MTIAWITSIFGDIDEPKPIPDQSVDFVHYHFSEQSNPVFLNGHNDRRKALFFKTQMHKIVHADYYIYTDGKIRVIHRDFIRSMMNQLHSNEFGILKHEKRRCIYKEVDHIENCIKHGNEYMKTRYGASPIRKKVDEYRAKGFPPNNGLNDCKIFIVKNTKKMNDLFDQWWNTCLTIDSFDQISIQYLAWKNRVRIVPITFKQTVFLDIPHKILK
jgi:alkaline ceramidase TOD1/glycosyltransferase MUCI70-like protein